MDMTSFWTKLEQSITKYDLLTHPFYKAWAKGELTKDDLQMYAKQYYQHVDAFPEYLHELAQRLPEGGLRSAIEENRQDELGSQAADCRSHSDMWLDFVEGMGASIDQAKNLEPIPAIKELISQFHMVSKQKEVIEALAAFYTYESQVPRIAQEKAAGLKEHYGAEPATYRYFSVHSTADIEHANVWRHLINEEINGDQNKMELALNSAELTAAGLWKVLDGIEEQRTGMPVASACPC
jgi:pyrroloquinoline-quinone synthase